MTVKNGIVILHPVNKDFILWTSQLIKCLPLTTSIKPKFTILHLMQPRHIQKKLERVLSREKKKYIGNSM